MTKVAETIRRKWNPEEPLGEDWAEAHEFSVSPGHTSDSPENVKPGPKEEQTQR